MAHKQVNAYPQALVVLQEVADDVYLSAQRSVIMIQQQQT